MKNEEWVHDNTETELRWLIHIERGRNVNGNQQRNIDFLLSKTSKLESCGEEVKAVNFCYETANEVKRLSSKSRSSLPLKTNTWVIKKQKSGVLLRRIPGRFGKFLMAFCCGVKVKFFEFFPWGSEFQPPRVSVPSPTSSPHPANKIR